VGFVASSDPGTNNLRLTCSYSQDKLKEMECELLISNIRDPKTVARVKENIERSSDGSSSHRAGALKLGLRKAFELKKQKKQPLGVLLQCGSSRCALYDNPVPRSSVGSNSICPTCSIYYMVCVGCRHTRTGDYASCQGCGKNFA